MMNRDVVITGAGLLTSLGSGVDQNWERLKRLETGLRQHPKEGVPPFLQVFGRVEKVETGEEVPPKIAGQMKFLNRGSLLGFVAAREAAAQSQLELGTIPPDRRALYVASGDTTLVGYEFMHDAMKEATSGTWRDVNQERLNRAALEKVNPFFLLESINNNLFSFLSAFVEFMGPNTSLASHSPCGGHALELAWRSIRQGEADCALAVGCGNWITEVPLVELEQLGMLSRCREGVRSYRPFDRRRDGFIPGEGGAALFLELRERAEKRGARILGGLKGFGNRTEFSGDRGLSVPPKVCVQSMASALEESACDPSDLAFICPHGSGSQKGDRSELHSILKLLGDKASDIPISGMKPYTGHLGAASDLAEVIFGLRALAERLVPATLNFTQAEKAFSALRISGVHQPCEKNHLLSVSYGIGGQSSSVVVSVGA